MMHPLLPFVMARSLDPHVSISSFVKSLRDELYSNTILVNNLTSLILRFLTLGNKMNSDQETSTLFQGPKMTKLRVISTHKFV